MDMNEYLDLFVEESKENIQLLSDAMFEFEKNPASSHLVDDMFRAAHTLKGMSGSMGFLQLQKLTHEMENTMDKIRNEELNIDEKVLSGLFKNIETLEELVFYIEDNREEPATTDALSEDVTLDNSSEEVITHMLTDIEKETIHLARVDKLNVYNIHFELEESCLLKNVRVMMFFNKLVKLGEIVKVDKSEEEIESNEEFDGVLNILFISDKDITAINQLKDHLSEVKDIKTTLYEIKEQTKNNIGINKAKEKNPTFTHSEDKNKINNNLQLDKNNSTNVNKTNKQSIRVDLHKLDEMMNIFESLVIEKGRLHTISDRLDDFELKDSLNKVNRYTTDMQHALLSMRMVPIETLFNRFPRMVRSISKELGKEVDFEIIGSDTELDRTVVQELGDPLVHLIRNSLDHGIENPDTREKNGKLTTGKVVLSAFHRGNEGFIEIKDDGAGIDYKKIKRKIINNGYKTKDELDSLTEEEVIQFIFSSGMSTAEKVTNISGRGVGLDVVKTKVESLGGEVKVRSVVNEGTTFIIKIPLTLSIIQALLVRDETVQFLIPLFNIEEILSTGNYHLDNLNNQHYYQHREKTIKVHRVSELYNDASKTLDNGNALIILQNSSKSFALVVDEVIDHFEVVLKPLNGYDHINNGMSGAAILGNGDVSFVLDVNFFNN